VLNHDELFELRPRVKLSFDEEKLIVKYRHPTSGRAGSIVAGLVRDVRREEK
jgi:hypothetical protein